MKYIHRICMNSNLRKHIFLLLNQSKCEKTQFIDYKTIIFARYFKFHEIYSIYCDILNKIFSKAMLLFISDIKL